MANLTISVDDEVLKRARIRALELGTSVNALLAAELARFADPGAGQRQALAGLFALADRATRADQARARKRGGRLWTRADLHER